MINVHTMRQGLQRLSEISDWKFALGLHIRFANPTLLYQTYPQSWVDYYSENGLVFVDPAVQWAIAHTGICDWSDLADQDESNVLGQAAEFGLRYGKVISIGKESRSFGFFAHPSKEIGRAETEEARALIEELHEMTNGVALMSEKELAPLRELNLSLRGG
ncbi:autoinducer binding domain-containing protein [Thioclava atlantica]|uniref:Autoinducer-binding domain-containing protein n=1 Tax=Thioclava atlantica TaxID=1317124 RepID=A0A085TY61_9RHOB|nr:autoinducer binding domain-containing protein [Thioclava atlantica]KFE35658.1 autoinducer-binding domain-containing protein [Thioclava atlantica]